MNKITSTNYQKDTLYPAVSRAIAEIVQDREVVTPVEVLLRLQRISRQQYEDWRFGRIAYLERAFLGSLGKAGRILRIVEFHSASLGLTPSRTEYRQWGKKGRNRRIVLRFSKSGEPRLDAAYSTHFLTNAQHRKKLNEETRAKAKATQVKAQVTSPTPRPARITR
jgi:hypothetical protein